MDGRSIVLNDPETNTFLIPSCVAFTETNCLVGESARTQAAGNLPNTIYDTKRLIGRTFQDQNVQNDLEFWPFAVINSDRGPMIQVTQGGTIKNLSPIEIGSLIIRKLKSIAEHHLVHNNCERSIGGLGGSR